MVKIIKTYPLSPMQQGILINTLREPNSGVDIEQISIHTQENLDIPNLVRAWEIVVTRHEILRTSFDWEGTDDPVQHVHETVNLPFETHDWTAHGTDVQEEKLGSFLQTDRLLSFDLSKTPLQRITLIKLGSREYKLIWTFHHILMDGRSFPIILNEVYSIYDAICRDQELKLGEPVPYQEYIDWLSNQVLSGAQAYWQGVLKGYTAPTQLGIDRIHQRNTEEPVIRGRKKLALSTRMTSELRTLADQNQLTINTILQGAWGLLLSSYSGSEEVVFGTVKTHRNSDVIGGKLRTMVGLLINTLPIRVKISPDISVTAWLQELRSQWISLRNFEHTPLALIQKWSDIPPGSSLFESVIGFERCGLTSASEKLRSGWENCSIELYENPSFPLTLSGYIDQTMVLDISYNHGRFDDQAIIRLLGHLKVVLGGFIADPGSSIAKVSLLSDAEKNKILIEWNDTRREGPHKKCIHELFESQVELNPEKLAVVYNDEKITYGELNRRSNQLANYLKNIGVGPEVVVGFCLVRSIDLVISILGIMKAGGAYFPLDPAYPDDRLAYLLSDSKISILIINQAIQKKLPGDGVKIIDLESDWVVISQHSTENPVHEVSLNNLAYVIYTSGSTGLPKGTLINHIGLSNVAFSQQTILDIASDDRILQFFSVSFDAATFEIVMALGTGATICSGDKESLLPGLDLQAFIMDNGITAAVLPPSTLRVLPEDEYPSLRIIAVAGDVCPPELAELWASGRQFFNLYGPTECTIWSTFASYDDENKRLPIGKPIPNVKVFVLDEYLRPVPVGINGELYISGINIGRGYLRRPGLTAERFIPNPFGVGDRLYKTGDIVKWTSDGSLEFIGRFDNQVKIRGYRIELGEIETTLSEHRALRGAIVLSREVIPGENHLVSYVVPKKGSDISPTKIRQFLLEKLPEYMVPNYGVVLDAFPLTPNGKIDRKILPIPSYTFSNNGSFVEYPHSPVEEKLVDIWKQVLDLEGLSIHDNFFVLGGHSLIATSLIGRIRDVFKKDVQVQSLFDYPTVAELAKLLISIDPNPIELPEQSPLKPMKSFPLSFAQERMWFIDHLEDGNQSFNPPSAFRFLGPLDIDVLKRSIQAVVQRHETLRTRFVTENWLPRQVIDHDRQVDLEEIQLEESGDTLHEFIWRDIKEVRLDIEQGPLLRTILYHLDKEEYIFAWMVHHIVSDAWSNDIFINDISNIYTAFMNDEDPSLPNLPIQYIDFSLMQREKLQGEYLEHQLEYWRNQLAGAEATTIPLDFSRPQFRSFNGDYVSFHLPDALVRHLQILGQKAGVTLFITLLSVFKILLYRYSGQSDVVIGSPVSNRSHQTVEKLIGLFLNNMVLRSDISGSPSFLELLNRVRKTALDAYQHQEVPFEFLLGEVKKPRDLSRTEYIQIFFNFHDLGNEIFRLPGIEVQRFSLGFPVAQFDLTVYVYIIEGKATIIFNYNTDLFSRVRMSSLLAQYKHLLEQIADNPTRSIDSYSLRTQADLPVLPDPTIPLTEPETKPVTEMFMTWVIKTPNQIAISQGNRTWSYLELAQQANTVAQSLFSRQLGHGSVVGITGSRSFGLIAGMLGILLSGNILLPIDPVLPSGRKKIMLDEADVIAVIYVSDSLSDKSEWLISQENLEIIVIGEDGDEKITSDKLQLPKISPQDPAYIFYTSGTTGVPKGILGNHKGLSHFLDWQRNTFEIGSDDRIPQLINLSFDVVLRDIFLPLISGAVLCIHKNVDSLAPNEILTWLEQEQVTLLHSVPTLIQSWLGDIPEGVSLSTLRWLFPAGEQLTDAIVRRWRNSFPAAGEIINLYGVTETTMAKCFYKVPKDPTPGVQPGGWSLPQSQVLIFREDNNLCGVGEPGEVVIRTPFRTNGYINASEENQERFIQNPFRDDEDDLFYFTGDLGRYQPDGSVVILGRLDDQIKIRGIRIEPDEINAVLGRNTGIDASVVIAREKDFGDKFLTAYYSTKQPTDINPSQLRSYLINLLPIVMVPAFFIRLDQIPLLPNGKVNRKELPIPEFSQSFTEDEFILPRTNDEELLLSIWKDVLLLDRISIHQNFFELGGHSLQATRVLNRIRLSFNVELSIMTFFENATIPGLVKAIRNRIG